MRYSGLSGKRQRGLAGFPASYTVEGVPLWNIRNVLLAAGAAILFTVLLNAPHLLLAFQGKLTIIDLLNHGSDEAYYWALLRQAAEGASLRNASTQAVLPQAWLLALTHWSLLRVVFLGDLLYPALAVFSLVFAAIAVMRSRVLGALTALLAASTLGTYWLRTANPQLPYVLLAAYAAVYFSGDRRARAYFLRGLLIGCLCSVQILYASFLVIVEGVDLLRRLIIARESVRDVAPSFLTLGATAFLAALPKLFVLLFSSSAASSDQLHRLGLIPSHYPGAPFFQIHLLLALALLLILRRRAGSAKLQLDLIITVIIAALVGLNQAVIHGIDATFSSYYVNVLLLLQWGILPFVLLLLLGRTRISSIIIAGVTAFSLLVLLQTTFAENAFFRPHAEAFGPSDDAAVLSWLARQPGADPVAAPIALANFIQAFTDHDALLSLYTYNFPLSDRELAERYALQQSLFPSAESPDPTYPTVFGQYLGLLTARTRTACRLWSALVHRPSSCAVDPTSFIIHRELLPILTAAPDVPALLKKYHVHFIVTPGSLSSAITAICPRDQMIGTYEIYRCEL